jgi:carbonic anhydrase/acetyltransferase-like protein (isoleucine patch superfamily)
MALILPFGGRRPRIGRDVFLAPNATLIGDVEIADEASVWFGAVLRGDIGPIRIGPRSNVQDLACVHMTEGLSAAVVGADVTIGHGAILHGCVVEDRCLVGMGSVILDNAQIGAGSLVAAGSVVTPKTVVPPRSLVRGAPAKVIREVTEAEGALGIDGAVSYRLNARRFRAICGELTETELFSTNEHARPTFPPELRGTHEDDDRQRVFDFGNDRGAGED